MNKEKPDKVFVCTFGCSANVNNSEIIVGLLKKAGFGIVGSVNEADCVVVNTCIVKGPTENRVIKEIRKIPKNKKLVVAGCMPLARKELLEEIAPDASLIGCNVGDVVKAVESKEKAEIIRKQTKLGLPKENKQKIISIIQISEGCKGNCAYCIVKLAKGSLISYPAEKIIEEAEKGVCSGCKEIWLTSQDCAVYEYNLAKLVEKVCSIEGDFKIRLGMMNPNKVLPILNDLIDAYENEKVFKFLHLPVQSGNDEVLKRMNRDYKVRDFKKIIKEFRKRFPEMTVSTDIIVGFPGETEKQFMDSVKLIKEIKPEIVNISRFWPRPGTEAAKLSEQIHGNITKERSKALTKVFEKIALEKNKKWIGWKGEVLVDEKGKKGKKSKKNEKNIVGRNYAYRPVVLAGQRPIGSKALVEVFEATPYHLLAKIL